MVLQTRKIRSPSPLAIASFWPVVALAAALAAPGTGMATEVVSVSNEFMISRDFTKIVLEGASAREARVFVDPIRMVSAAENEKFHPVAVNALGARLQVVNDKNDANYLVQIIAQTHTDYAIRNPQRQPAAGYMLISICKYPIKDIADACENLTYFYFRRYDLNELFPKVFAMWLDATVLSGR